MQAVMEAGMLYATDRGMSPVARRQPRHAGGRLPRPRSASLPELGGSGDTPQAWYEVTRPFSWTASIIPVLAGAGLAWANGHFTFWIFLLVLIGGVGLQIGTNVINEIYDVRQGIDNITSPRASHALFKGALTEREAFGVAFGAFAMVALVGIVLVALRGWPMLLLGVVGLVAGYSYTGPPFQYKFHALGVPLVAVLMGPLEVVGTYYAITGGFDVARAVCLDPDRLAGGRHPPCQRVA